MIGMRLEGAIRRTLRERKDRVSLLGRALGDPSRAPPLMQRFDMTTSCGCPPAISRACAAVSGRTVRHPPGIIILAMRLEMLAQKMKANGRDHLVRNEKNWNVSA